MVDSMTLMDAVFSTVGEAIAAARKRAGLTQAEAADRLGVSRRTWQDYERGVIDAQQRLTDIEEALELPHGWFVAQFNALERLYLLESRIDQIEQRLSDLEATTKDNGALLREILRVVLSSQE